MSLQNITPKTLNVSKKIGEGGNGAVYLIEHKEENKYYAAKQSLDMDDETLNKEIKSKHSKKGKMNSKKKHMK